MTFTNTSHVFLIDPLTAMTIASTGHNNELLNFLFNPLQIIITTSTGHNKELPKLEKTYTNKAKYSSQNDSSIFKMTNI